MAVELKTQPEELIEEYRHGFHDSEDKYVFKSDKGLTREIVERISEMKDEPAWMRDVPPQSATRSSSASRCRRGATPRR